MISYPIGGAEGGYFKGDNASPNGDGEDSTVVTPQREGEKVRGTKKAYTYQVVVKGPQPTLRPKEGKR